MTLRSCVDDVSTGLLMLSISKYTYHDASQMTWNKKQIIAEKLGTFRFQVFRETHVKDANLFQVPR